MGQLVNTVFFEATEKNDSTARVSVAHYSAEEVIRQFLGLYSCMDFKFELEDLGIGKFQFLRRKKALRHLRSLAIALWGLALQRSFPSDHEEFFSSLFATAPMLADGGKEAGHLRKLTATYVELLEEKREKDFLPVANHLAEVLALHSKDLPRLRLKLSLLIRNLYTLIFNKLV